MEYMDKGTIQQCLADMIAENYITDNTECIEPSTELISLGIDSIGMMTLFVLMEERFLFTVEEDDIFIPFQTIGDVVNFVEQIMNKSKKELIG